MSGIFMPWMPRYYQGWLRPRRINGYILTPMKPSPAIEAQSKAFAEYLLDYIKSPEGRPLLEALEALGRLVEERGL